MWLLSRRRPCRARAAAYKMPRPVPLPALKTITWVTTDCYGTLIDWEKGIVDACKKEAAKDGFSFEEGPFLARFMEVQAEIMAGSYELYAEVLRRTIVKVAREVGWEIEPSRAQFLPDSVAYWLPFREANAAMDRLGKRYEIGIISNIDDKLLGISRRHLRTELDLVVTAQQVRSYKPDPVHFKECARRIGGKKGWVHIGCDYTTDVAPLLKMKVPVIWVNRHGEKLDGRKAPSATVKNFRDAAKKLGAANRPVLSRLLAFRFATSPQRWRFRPVGRRERLFDGPSQPQPSAFARPPADRGGAAGAALRARR